MVCGTMSVNPLPRVAANSLNLRPEHASDEPFLFELYGSTRAEELALANWDEPTRTKFIEMQFRAQRDGYRQMFPNGQFDIVLDSGTRVGRIVVNVTDAEIRIVDLVIAETQRGRGFGTELLRRLLQQAAAAGKPLRLQVVKGNRAAQLYQRLGFAKMGESVSHEQFEWRMAPAATSSLPSSVRLPLLFDAARLQADLDRIFSGEFVPHFNQRYYEGDWSAVPLRSVGGRTDQIYPDPTATRAFADTPLLERCAYVREVLASLQVELQAVRFLRLKAGSIVKEHRDHNLSLEDGEVRLHIPVRTNPELEFVLGGERVVMNPGEVWYHNFNLPHSVNNKGATDRIHLVVDCFVSDWLRELITTTAARTT
jgi:ribosomal protein S18 acetylase RimI-like enzyme/quercetin dioxygenase-like cupin family protein